MYYVMFIQFCLYLFKSVTALENLLVKCTSNNFEQTVHHDLLSVHFPCSYVTRR